ncbi:MAG: hypothetical protein AAFO80_09640 [Pseudomonadota bacterium]
MSKRMYVLQSATAAFFAVSATASGALTPDPETGLIPVRLPTDLCAFENGLPSDLIRQITQRSDFDTMLVYMAENCPELALDLADFATAAISASAFDADDDDDDDDDDVVVRRTGNVTVEDTAGDTGTGEDGDDSGNGTGGGNGSDGGDTADAGEKDLPGWKLAKKNGLLWKWQKKMARWEAQQAERDAWRAEKKANKYGNDKGLEDWKMAKKQARWEAQREADEQRQAEKKANKQSGGDELPDWKQAKKEARWEADRIAAEEAKAAKKASKYDPNDGSGAATEVAEEAPETEVEADVEEEVVAQVD